MSLKPMKRIERAVDRTEVSLGLVVDVVDTTLRTVVALGSVFETLADDLRKDLDKSTHERIMDKLLEFNDDYKDTKTKPAKEMLVTCISLIIKEMTTQEEYVIYEKSLKKFVDEADKTEEG